MCSSYLVELYVVDGGVASVGEDAAGDEEPPELQPATRRATASRALVATLVERVPCPSIGLDSPRSAIGSQLVGVRKSKRHKLRAISPVAVVRRASGQGATRLALSNCKPETDTVRPRRRNKKRALRPARPL